MKYRVKPDIVDAEQFHEAALPLPFRDEGVCCFDGKRWYMTTRLGKIQIVNDDWIIKYSDGTFDRMRPEVFNETYEPA